MDDLTAGVVDSVHDVAWHHAWLACARGHAHLGSCSCGGCEHSRQCIERWFKCWCASKEEFLTRCAGWKLDADTANAAGTSTAESAGSVLTALAASVPQLGPNEVHLSSVPEAASTGLAPGANAATPNGKSSTETVASSLQAPLETTSWELRSSESDAAGGMAQGGTAAAAGRSNPTAAEHPPMEVPDSLAPSHAAKGAAAAEQLQIPRNGFGSHASAASAAAAAKFAGF